MGGNILYQILKKEQIGPDTYRMEVSAPRTARRAQPGQFVMLRVNADSERMPLTIAGSSSEAGIVTIIFQAVGHSTRLLAAKEPGEGIHDFLGPLGKPAQLPDHGRVLCVGGGVGVAVVYPEVKALFEKGVHVDVIIGARNEKLLILEDEVRAVCNNLYITTDDGSRGRKGLVTDVMKELFEAGEKYDEVITIGPVIMMKFVSLLTKQYGIKTTASMNPIMVDGTGMCGGCRVTVGGESKYACVDGPEFDAHQIDFDEAMRRLNTYKDDERHACEEDACHAR